MDIISGSGAFWIIGILLYGGFEYQRREQNHKMTLLALRYGKEAPAAGMPTPWKSISAGIIAVALLAIGVDQVVRSRSVLGDKAFYVLAAIFLAIAAALVFVRSREIRAYRAKQTMGKDAQP